MTTTDWSRFAQVYNDLGNYPTLADVGAELGLSYQTVRNKATILRALKRQGKKVPALETRVKETKPKEQHDPKEHAQARAVSLAADITSLITGTRYPITNPDAIRVESYTYRRWDRGSRSYLSHEGIPRTYVTDTLMVAPIKKAGGRKFIFTGAQNDTPVHQGFWNNLKAYAKKIGAEIVVGPWTYETYWWHESNATARAYDPVLTDHLCFGQLNIGDKFMFVGEMNTLPTADAPISNLVTYTRGRWGVFPHAKRQLKSVPTTDPDVPAHQVMTTGSCTIPKVFARKAGVKSIFHHVIGAVIVEFDQDGTPYSSHISANKDGAFYHFDAYVADGKVRFGNRVRSIVWFDIHRAKLTAATARAAFGIDLKTGKHVTSNNLLDMLRPAYSFFHDLFDNQTRNHHHAKDNAYSYELAYRGRESVLGEIIDAADFLAAVRRPDNQAIVVDSNHDLALERYVREGRYRMDGINIRFGLQLEDAYLAHREKVADAIEAEQKTPVFSMVEFAIRRARMEDLHHVKWAYDGKSFKVDGIECGHHGFRGPNGSFGNVAGFARLGAKMSIGDKHSPEIFDGVYVAGVAELQHGYNKGPSGWNRSVIVQYEDGKRALFTLQNGKWRP